MKVNRENRFKFNNNMLIYLDHSYNHTMKSGRSIEVSIVRHYLKKYNPKKCLEIGNVTNNYYNYFRLLMIPKIVVDKYEKGLDIINKDIKDYTSKTKFNFIYSISTFEHMDSDRGRNKDYIKKNPKENSNVCNNMIHVINNLLNQNGVFIITAPIAYTVAWNQLVFNPKIMNKKFFNVKSINIYYFERFSRVKWRQKYLTSLEIDKIKDLVVPLNEPCTTKLISIVEIIK